MELAQLTTRRGWHRLWVLVGILYGIAVVGIATLSWPSGDSGIHTYEGTERDTGTIIQIDAFGGVPTEEMLLAASADGAMPDDWFDQFAVNEHTRVKRMNIEGRRPVYFPPDTLSSTMERAVARHVDGLWPERREWLLTVAVGIVVPMGALYLFGLGIGWVIRGFRGR